MKPVSFPRRQQGQIVFIFLFGLIPLVVLVALLINTGTQVTERIRVQNAADAAALTQASWSARSLNVMSMNNVAITQSLSINLVTSALMLSVIEIQGLTAERYYKYVAAIIKSFGTAIGVYGPKLIHLTEHVQIPLIELAAKRPDKINRRFVAVTLHLAKMNEHIVKGFPEFSKSVVQEGALQNGVDEDGIRLFTGFHHIGKVGADTAQLPVEKANVRNTRLSSGGLGNVSLWASGLYGKLTPMGTFGNFERHGYSDGPQPLAVEDAKKQTKDIVRALKNRHETKPLEIETYSDVMWVYGALTHSVFVFETPFFSTLAELEGEAKKLRTIIRAYKKAQSGDLLGAGEALFESNMSAANPFEVKKTAIAFRNALRELAKFDFDVRFKSFDFYKTTPNSPLSIPAIPTLPSFGPFDEIIGNINDLTRTFGAGSLFPSIGPLEKLMAGVSGSRDDWSLLAFTRNERPRPTLLPSSFPAAMNSVYGSAQAEIYNALSYDLYTQNWRAKLVPTRLLSNPASLRPRRSDMVKTLQGFGPLSEIYAGLKPEEATLVNAH